MTCIAEDLTRLVPSTINRSGLSPYYKEKLLNSVFSLTTNPIGELVVSTNFCLPHSEEMSPDEEEEYDDLQDRLNWILFTIEESLA